MRRLLIAATLGLAALLAAAAPRARADTDSATHYYLSLGDSLAASAQPNGDETHGYAEQLHALLAADDPKLKLVKLGCGGESSVSMRFGSQLPTTVLSCGSPRYYKNVLYPKGIQLDEAGAFLDAHKGKITLITIDIGANDLQRLGSQGELVICLFEPAGCGAQVASLATNLAAILATLQAAAPGVPIVGMTYYDVFAPLGEPLVDARVDAANAAIATTYAAAGIPVADVAGAFHNDDPPLAAQLVCAWTWFCTVGDVHPNTTGYGVIAHEFLEVIQP